MQSDTISNPTRDWVNIAKRLFKIAKPIHFTDFTHCRECAEHNETLMATNIDKIGLEELGNPGWDPLCFCSVEGLKYFMPALVRLSLETINSELYIDQFIFHLSYDGDRNRLLESCSQSQKKFICDFLDYMIENHAKQIDDGFCTDDLLLSHEYWSKQ